MTVNNKTYELNGNPVEMNNGNIMGSLIGSKGGELYFIHNIKTDITNVYRTSGKLIATTTEIIFS